LFANSAAFATPVELRLRTRGESGAIIIVPVRQHHRRTLVSGRPSRLVRPGDEGKLGFGARFKLPWTQPAGQSPDQRRRRLDLINGMRRFRVQKAIPAQ
jgi:hypothetical protein